MTLVLASLPLFADAWTWGPGGGGWHAPFLPLLWLAVIGLVVWVACRRRSNGPSDLDSARAVVAERYARGEISTDEYRERTQNLR